MHTSPDAAAGCWKMGVSGFVAMRCACIISVHCHIQVGISVVKKAVIVTIIIWNTMKGVQMDDHQAKKVYKLSTLLLLSRLTDISYGRILSFSASALRWLTL
jgi:hypothetical protein